ncbi:uncharacterized protein LOC118503746 [Anopheles stephensi]|uniref:uncharacterized protein LOC118503746 n=1 Tax=Anopheles stephensi TaxID=30069 RepID=UPI00165896BA|nr:uncharacterized protein LOC118503746 [Anopheles stephensi]
MPYVLVETNDAAGNKELLAAPATWIQRRGNGTSYLRWPNVRNFNMLNALLADDRSQPMAAWETHECSIKCSNIQSLALAGKMIKTLQKHWNSFGTSAHKRTIESSDDVTVSPVCKKSLTESSDRQQQQQQQVETVSEAEPTLTSLDDFDEPNEQQLIGMLDELGSLVKKRHDEARKKMLDGFYRVENSLKSIVNEAERRVQESVAQRTPSANDLEFCVNPLTCTEEMNDFEERLKGEEYRKHVERWIDCTIGYELNPEYRMRVILDALFDMTFLAKFSWTGSGLDKISFGRYNNIVNLFNYTGTTDTHLATPRYVGQFFKKKLKHLASQISNKDVSNSTSPSSFGNYENNSTQRAVESLREITVKDSPNEVKRSDNRPTVTQFPPAPFNCIVEVDEFEAQLNDPVYLKQVHKWINEQVAYEVNPEIRMMEILYMLFDNNFLPCFTWVGAKKDSYAMKKYKNVIKLFQYVGTTVAHRADYACVEHFFTKKLRYAWRRADDWSSSR